MLRGCGGFLSDSYHGSGCGRWPGQGIQPVSQGFDGAQTWRWDGCGYWRRRFLAMKKRWAEAVVELAREGLGRLRG